MFVQISAVLRDRLEPYAQRNVAPFSSAMMALDTTTLDPVDRTLPSLRDVADGDRQLLPVKLADVFEIQPYACSSRSLSGHIV